MDVIVIVPVTSKNTPSPPKVNAVADAISAPFGSFPSVAGRQYVVSDVGSSPYGSLDLFLYRVRQCRVCGESEIF